MKRLVFALILPLLMGGCAAAVGGGAATGVSLALEDRTGEDQVTDTKIMAEFNKNLLSIDSELVLDVSLDVWEQRGLLTGTLSDAKTKDRVVALLRSEKRLKIFHDEVQIVSNAEQAQRREQQKKKESSTGDKVAQTLDDVWIETKIKGQLLAARHVTSVNYRWRSVNNRVYVIGRAQNEGERDKVLGVLRNTEGVKSVKHFIQVKPVP